jgi:hypothetical protein
MTHETFNFRAYTRLKQLQHLIQTKQIDKDFYWLSTAQNGGVRAGAPVHSSSAA